MVKMLHRMKWARRLAPNQRGQALIETALTIPFLMLIVVGGLELGRFAYAAIEVSSAAKAAVQYGAQSSSAAFDCCGSGTGMYTAAADGAPDLSGLVLTSSYSLACSNGTAPTYPYGSTNENLDCPNAAIETVLSVTVTAKVDTLVHFPAIPNTLTLYGQATQKVLGN